MKRIRILAIIPARLNSKGLIGKNMKLLKGKPLVQWTIEAAKKSKLIDNIFISTDSSKLIKLIRKLKLEVPKLRPKFLSQDATPMHKVVLHALSIKKNFTHFVLLQPTSPLRTALDIDNLINQAMNTGSTSFVSISEVKDHPRYMYSIKKNKKIKNYFDFKKIYNRQKFEKIYRENGAIYFESIKEFKENKNFINSKTKGFIMPFNKSIDIDTIYDFKIAEFFLKKKIDK